MAVSLVRAGAISGAVAAELTLNLTHAALLRQNVFEKILHRPGAKALPASAGEAVSRFRDDVLVISRFISWTLDPVGQAVATTIALVVLVGINPWVTVVVFVPLVLVIMMVNLASRRIQQYRSAAQQSIGEVTGLLGEVFGAVQAVKGGKRRRERGELFQNAQRGEAQGIAQRSALHPATQHNLGERCEPGHGRDAADDHRLYARRPVHRGGFCALRLLYRVAGADNKHVRQLSDAVQADERFDRPPAPAPSDAA